LNRHVRGIEPPMLKFLDVCPGLNGKGLTSPICVAESFESSKVQHRSNTGKEVASKVSSTPLNGGGSVPEYKKLTVHKPKSSIAGGGGVSDYLEQHDRDCDCFQCLGPIKGRKRESKPKSMKSDFKKIAFIGFSGFYSLQAVFSCRRRGMARRRYLDFHVVVGCNTETSRMGVSLFHELSLMPDSFWDKMELACGELHESGVVLQAPFDNYTALGTFMDTMSIAISTYLMSTKGEIETSDTVLRREFATMISGVLELVRAVANSPNLLSSVASIIAYLVPRHFDVTTFMALAGIDFGKSTHKRAHEEFPGVVEVKDGEWTFRPEQSLDVGDLQGDGSGVFTDGEGVEYILNPPPRSAGSSSGMAKLGTSVLAVALAFGMSAVFQTKGDPALFLHVIRDSMKNVNGSLVDVMSHLIRTLSNWDVVSAWKIFRDYFTGEDSRSVAYMGDRLDVLSADNARSSTAVMVDLGILRRDLLEKRSFVMINEKSTLLPVVDALIARCTVALQERDVRLALSRVKPQPLLFIGWGSAGSGKSIIPLLAQAAVASVFGISAEAAQEITFYPSTGSDYYEGMESYHQIVHRDEMGSISRDVDNNIGSQAASLLDMVSMTNTTLNMAFEKKGKVHTGNIKVVSVNTNSDREVLCELYSQKDAILRRATWIRPVCDASVMEGSRFDPLLMETLSIEELDRIMKLELTAGVMRDAHAKIEWRVVALLSPSDFVAWCANRLNDSQSGRRSEVTALFRSLAEIRVSGDKKFGPPPPLETGGAAPVLASVPPTHMSVVKGAASIRRRFCAAACDEYRFGTHRGAFDSVLDELRVVGVMCNEPEFNYPLTYVLSRMRREEVFYSGESYGLDLGDVVLQAPWLKKKWKFLSSLRRRHESFGVADVEVEPARPVVHSDVRTLRVKLQTVAPKRSIMSRAQKLVRDARDEVSSFFKMKYRSGVLTVSKYATGVVFEDFVRRCAEIAKKLLPFVAGLAVSAGLYAALRSRGGTAETVQAPHKLTYPKPIPKDSIDKYPDAEVREWMGELFCVSKPEETVGMLFSPEIPGKMRDSFDKVERNTIKVLVESILPDGSRVSCSPHAYRLNGFMVTVRHAIHPDSVGVDVTYIGVQVARSVKYSLSPGDWILSPECGEYCVMVFSEIGGVRDLKKNLRDLGKPKVGARCVLLGGVGRERSSGVITHVGQRVINGGDYRWKTNWSVQSDITDTTAGDCGRVLAWESPEGWAFGGIHYASQVGSGFAVADYVPIDDVIKLGSGLRVLLECLSVDCSMESMMEPDQVRPGIPTRSFISIPQFEGRSCLPVMGVVGNSKLSASGLEPTSFYSSADEKLTQMGRRYLPAVMKKVWRYDENIQCNREVSPFEYGMDVSGDPSGSPKCSVLLECVEGVCDLVFKQLQPASCGPVGLDKALGPIGSLKSVDASTGAGLSISGKKGAFFVECDVDGQTIRMAKDELRERTFNLLGRLVDGDVPLGVSRVALKDESLKEKKIVSVATRLIYVVSMEEYMLNRMMFAECIESSYPVFQRLFGMCFCVNALGPDWAKIYARSVDLMDGKRRTLCGDFEKYDRRHHFTIFVAAMEIWCRVVSYLWKGPRGLLLASFRLVWMTMYRVTFVDGVCLRAWLGGPSGHLFTVFFNCFVQLLCWHQAYCEVRGDGTFEEFFVDFVIHWNSLGDDCSACLPVAVCEWFTCDKIVDSMRMRCGQIITGAGVKADLSYDGEAVFLQRTFCRIGDRVVSPLNIASLYKMLLYWEPRKGNDKYQHESALLVTFWCETLFHPEPVRGTLRDFVNSLRNEYCPGVEFPSDDVLWKRFDSGGMILW
jgi:hypothetical protein